MLSRRLKYFVIPAVLLTVAVFVFCRCVLKDKTFNLRPTPSIDVELFGTIAVCIGGQIGRAMPQFLKQGLIDSNPNFKFDLFFNFQTISGGLIYNTREDKTFEPSKLGLLSKNKEVVRTHLKNAFFSNHSKVHQVAWHTARSDDDWKKKIAADLDRIWQYTSTAHTILNMYAMQEHCTRQILETEKIQNVTYNYIISTREDVYFHKPMNLFEIFQSEASNSCDLFCRDCLSWGGISMRLQLFTRNAGIVMLGNRLSHFSYLHVLNLTIQNPEQFELHEAESHNISLCPRSINLMPVIAARHTHSDRICFIDEEWGMYGSNDVCIPSNCLNDSCRQYISKNSCNNIVGP